MILLLRNHYMEPHPRAGAVPGYFQGCAYGSHCVAVLGDTVAVRVCITAQRVQWLHATLAEAFRFPLFADYEPLGEEVFHAAWQQV